MQQVKVFCDSCEKECLQGDGAGTFAGAISKMNIKMEKQFHRFQQDFCRECSEVILNFIVELKKDIGDKKE